MRWTRNRRRLAGRAGAVGRPARPPGMDVSGDAGALREGAAAGLPAPAGPQARLDKVLSSCALARLSGPVAAQFTRNLSRKGAARAGRVAERRGLVDDAVGGDHLPGDGQHRSGHPEGGAARLGRAAARRGRGHAGAGGGRPHATASTGTSRPCAATTPDPRRATVASSGGASTRARCRRRRCRWARSASVPRRPRAHRREDRGTSAETAHGIASVGPERAGPETPAGLEPRPPAYSRLPVPARSQPPLRDALRRRPRGHPLARLGRPAPLPGGADAARRFRARDPRRTPPAQPCWTPSAPRRAPYSTTCAAKQCRSARRPPSMPSQRR